MADQTSNFSTIFNIISKSDFTGLIKGSETIKKFAETTTASTRTVSDLNKATDASVTYIKDYFGSWEEGIASVSKRFTDFGKNGASMTGTLKLVGGTIKDVLGVGLEQTETGLVAMGKLLSIDMVYGAAAFAGAILAAGAALKAVSGLFSESLVSAVAYTRNLETARIMVSGFTKDNYQLTQSLVDSADRASWSRVGKAWSGYIEFFNGLGKVATAVKGNLSYFAADMLSMIPGATRLGQLGKDMGEWAVNWARSSASIKRLRGELGNFKDVTTDVTALNDKLAQLGDALGKKPEEVQAMFDGLNRSTLDANKSILILTTSAQAALGSEFLRQNAAEFQKSLAAISTVAEIPVSSFKRLGVEIENTAGLMVNSSQAIDNLYQRLVDLRAITVDEADAQATAAKTGKVMAADLEQRLARQKAFGTATVQIEADTLAQIQALRANDKTVDPRQKEADQANLIRANKAYLEENAQMTARYAINENNRIAELRGNQTKNLENNIIMERALLQAQFAANVTNETETLKLIERARQQEHEINMQRREDANRVFTGQIEAQKAAMDAAKTAGVALNGLSEGTAQLALRDQLMAKIKAEYALKRGDATMSREEQTKLLNTNNAFFASIKNIRKELIDQIEGSLQTIDQLSRRSGTSTSDDLARAKSLAAIHITAINQELAMGRLTDKERAEKLNERVKVEQDLLNEHLRVFNSIGETSKNISKESLGALRTQAIFSDRVVANIVKGEGVLTGSPSQKNSIQNSAPGSAGDVFAGLKALEETLKAEKENQGSINKLYADIQGKSVTQVADIYSKFSDKLKSGNNEETQKAIASLVLPKLDEIVKTNMTGVKPSDTKDTQQELARLVKGMQDENKKNTEAMAKLHEDIATSSAKLYAQGLGAAEAYDVSIKASQVASDNIKVALEAAAVNVKKFLEEGGSTAFTKLVEGAEKAGTINATVDTRTREQMVKIAEGLAKTNEPLIVKIVSLTAAMDKAANDAQKSRTALRKQGGLESAATEANNAVNPGGSWAAQFENAYKLPLDFGDLVLNSIGRLEQAFMNMDNYNNTRAVQPKWDEDTVLLHAAANIDNLNR